MAAEVKDHLRRVDAMIRSQTAAFDPAMIGYVKYVCETRGKGIRPTLALLAGGACGKITDKHLLLGVAVELVHLASLIHDDIMDRAETRRGMPTVHTKWGPEVAVLLGDCLFAHALMLCSNLDSADMAKKIAGAANEVCQGEILQTRQQFDLNLSMDDYFKVIRMKTASLFSVATELGARLSDSTDDTVNKMRIFGEHLGVAYQVYDDCLDLAGSENDTGKTLGTDLMKGKWTLPVLIYLSEASAADLENARAILVHGDIEQKMYLIALLHTSGAIHKATQRIRSELEKSSAAISDLPDNSFVKALKRMPEFFGLTYQPAGHLYSPP